MTEQNYVRGRMKRYFRRCFSRSTYLSYFLFFSLLFSYSATSLASSTFDYTSPTGTISSPYFSITARSVDSSVYENWTAATLELTGTKYDGTSYTFTDDYNCVVNGYYGGSYAAGVISCPTPYLYEGDYQATITVFDASGIPVSTAGSFTIDIDPLLYTGPSGKVTDPIMVFTAQHGTAEVYVSWREATLRITGTMYDGTPYSFTDEYNCVVNGNFGEQDSYVPGVISCPAPYLSDGIYKATIEVLDPNGVPIAASGFFSVGIDSLLYTGPSGKVTDPIMVFTAQHGTAEVYGNWGGATLRITGTMYDGTPYSFTDEYNCVVNGNFGEQDSYVPGVISCPGPYLSDGSYEATIEILDRNGMQMTASGALTVDVDPLVYTGPSGTITDQTGIMFTAQHNTEDVYMRWGDSATLRITGTMYDGSSYTFTDDYNCAVNGYFGESSYVHGVISCLAPVPPDGSYEVSIEVLDPNFKPMTASGFFSVAVNYPPPEQEICSWSGVMAPVNPSKNSTFKLGSTIPVKFRLSGVCASNPDFVAKLYFAKISDSACLSPTGVCEAEAISTSSATTGNQFRYDSESDLYIFNLSTKYLTPGRYLLRIDLGDGIPHTVEIALRR